MKTENSLVVHAADGTWNELTSAVEIFVVEFGADWCGPCKMMEPVLNDLATDFAGLATVATVDVEANPNLTAQYQIRNLPTLLIFKEGKLTNRFIGLTSRKVLADAIKSLVSVQAVID